nr:plasma protease C1 inhibitor [Pelodiscus sinensis]|eukprot:XP_006111024.1 plasma protease C1 inhibitor [Pelodiscus sinensis]
MKTWLILVWLVMFAGDVTGQEGVSMAPGKGADDGGEMKVKETQQGLLQGEPGREEPTGCLAASSRTEGDRKADYAAGKQGLKEVPEKQVTEDRSTTEPAKKLDKEPDKKPDKTDEEPANKPTDELANKPTDELAEIGRLIMLLPASQPANKAANEPANKPTNEPASKPANEAANEPTNEPTNKPTNEPTSEPTSKPTSEPTNKPTTAPSTETPTVSVTVPQRCPPSDPWGSCRNDSKEESHRVAMALTDFALKYYSKVAKTHGTDSNVVFSPLSVAVVLSQLLLGARDETKMRLETILSYPSDLLCVHAPLRHLLKSQAFVSTSLLFFRQDLSLNDAFRKQLKSFYNIEAQWLTGNETQDLRKVNKWVKDGTNGKIEELLKELEPDVQLMLINAIYFQAKWKTTFKVKNTMNEMFYRPGKSPVQVPMMTSKKYPLASFSDPSLKAKVGRLRLSHSMSLVVMVPEHSFNSLAEMEKMLTRETFTAVVKKLMDSPLKPTVVSLPRFKLDSSQDLMDILGQIDYGIFFDANLCGISEAEDLAVTNAQHRAVLELNEEGVEAAAATAISVARTAWVFEVQQPFLFVLWNDEHSFPVFMGHVSDPSRV